MDGGRSLEILAEEITCVKLRGLLRGKSGATSEERGRRGDKELHGDAIVIELHTMVAQKLPEEKGCNDFKEDAEDD